jgi:hypothetical protein
VRYGLSLRTLELQQRVENERRALERNVRELRGTVFVNPSGPHQKVGGRRQVRLDHTRTGVKHLLKGNPEHWQCFGEHQSDSKRLANRLNLREFHQAPNVLWTMCHGGMCLDKFKAQDGRPIDVISPSLLLCDGPVSTARLYAEGYDLRPLMLFHNSCCLLGDLRDERRSGQVEGFNSALALLGCRRVTSAMWELDDEAAAEFDKHFQSALLDAFKRPRGPHAFAIALKNAILAFRKAKRGKFDHEFFWAPYTLYGLG